MLTNNTKKLRKIETVAHGQEPAMISEWGCCLFPTSTVISTTEISHSIL